MNFVNLRCIIATTKPKSWTEQKFSVFNTKLRCLCVTAFVLMCSLGVFLCG